MKNIFTFSLILTCLIVSGQDKQRVKDAKHITFYGLDFTKAKMVGVEGEDFANPESIVEVNFTFWNLILLREPDKYNIENAIKKKATLKLDSAMKFNEQVDPQGLIVTNPNSIKQAQATEIVKNYADVSSEGVGMLFIVESFSKIEEEARYIVAFFDMKDGTILLINRVEGLPSGIGVKNYWANALAGALKHLRGIYPKWVE